MDIREIISQFTEDEYLELCRRADALGMESLSEEEQIVVLNYKN